MQRMLGVAAAALVFAWLATGADARTAVFARVKCVGLYCQIVTAPDPRHKPRPATLRRGWAIQSPKPRPRETSSGM